MHKTLYNLAKRNIMKYKKHYVIVSIIIFIVSLMMFSYLLITKNNDEVIKAYHLKTYGNWYTSIPMINEKPEVKEGIERYTDLYFKNEIQYGYVRNQGNYKDYLIGHVDNSIYDLCKIDVTSGKQLSKDNDILVSDTFAKKEKVKINNHINMNDKDYIIVGIIHTNNEGLPDIYTNTDDYVSLDYYANMELGNEGNISFYDENDNYYTVTLNYTYNPYGYDQNIINAKINDAIEVISRYFKIITVSLFILLSLTSSSLRKRKKEMALLRGIGMTTSQLIILILYENVFVTVLSTILAVVLSLIISLGFMYYQSTIYHIFLYQFDIPTIVSSLLFFISCVIISMTIPIISSSNNALSGSFDAQRFQYIQVRYRKLKKQTLSYLALRELKVNKKMNICYFIFILVLSAYGLMSLYNGHPIHTSDDERWGDYVSISTSNQNAYEEFSKQFSNQTFSMKEAYFDENIEIQYTELKNSSHYEFALLENNQFDLVGSFEGKLPSKSHEIVVTDKIKEITLSKEDYPEIFQDMNDSNCDLPVTINDKQYKVIGTGSDDENGYTHIHIETDKPQIGDDLLINNEEYKITGIIYENDDVFLPTLFMYKDDFQLFSNNQEITLYGRHYLENSEVDKVLTFLKTKNSGENGTYYNSSLWNTYDEEIDILNISVRDLIVIFLMGFVIILFLNYNNIENNFQDYQMYHILGMSYQEIKRKQIWKSIHMTWITAIPILLYFMVLIIFSIDHYMPVLEVLGMLIIVMIFYFIVYNVPLYLVLNNHKDEELRNGDE